MVIGKSRRDARTPRARELFGENAGAALDLLELLELAWHDCYADVSPSDEVFEDVWIVSEGQLPKLVQAARLAVEDDRTRFWDGGQSPTASRARITISGSGTATVAWSLPS
jgi:hypothetical protein